MATNIYNSISEAWAANAPLEALLPSSRIFHGRRESPTEEDQGDADFAAYAILDDLDDRYLFKTSLATWWATPLQLSVYAANLTAARAIQKLYRAVLADSSRSSVFIPTLDDGTFQEWYRESGGRLVEEGKLGKAMDTFILVRKQEN